MQRHKGAYIVELALVIPLFLLLVFGVLEISRAMYLFNTLEDVTRRVADLAANTNFTDESAKDTIRQIGIYRTTPGNLMLGSPITDAHIRIDYLAAVRDSDNNITLTEIPTGSLPACPVKNRIICMNDPHDPGCIRFVRVRMCDPNNTGACTPITYQTIVPLVDLALTIPTMMTITPAETLGFTPGMATCP
ncbi:TadE/TadG family type IV pilus assembly protein [Rugamonas brunnea]|nr:TadE/TadG family type IV pilus assembly protein [Rugamonas brunnea]